MRVFQPPVFAEVCVETTFIRTSLNLFLHIHETTRGWLKSPTKKAKHNGLVLLALCPETTHDDVVLPQSNQCAV